MTRFLTLCFLLFELTGCSATMPKTVNMPIVIVPQFQIPPKPKLMTASLTFKSSAMQVEKSHVIDLDAMITYSNQLLEILQSIQEGSK